MNRLPITDRECDELLLVKIRFYLKKEMPEKVAREILEKEIKQKSNLSKFCDALFSEVALNHNSQIIA
jgi:hypothetical protein